MHRSICILFLFVATTSSVYSTNLFTEIVAAFQKENVATRIVGGQEVTPYSRPYQVGLTVPWDTGLSYFCGASLIDTRNILTAAHCMDSFAGNITVYLGAHYMLPLASENATIVYTDDVVVHPNWNRTLLRHDIALVRLKEPIEFTDKFRPVLLPTDINQDYFLNTSVVTGWGRPLEFTSGLSPVLKEMSSYIISNYACRLAYMGYVEDSHICMASSVGNSICNGDPGGPLVVNGVQVGIISFYSSGGCAQGFPPGATRLTYYLDWINENLASTNTTTTNSTIVN